MKNKVLIIGGNSQDGYYAIQEYLKDPQYEVYASVRRHSTTEDAYNKIYHWVNNGKVNLCYMDLLDPISVRTTLTEVEPDIIILLAAFTHVGDSFIKPDLCFKTNILGPLYVLEVIKDTIPFCKVYAAGSSEQYGRSVNQNGFQDETTTMIPVSQYGISKLAMFDLFRVYKDSYNLFATSSVLFNHTSIHRSTDFVEAKIAKAAAAIKLGLMKEIKLGNLDSSRDFGWAGDYMRAVKLIMEQDEPEWYCVCTGQTHTIRDVLKYIFSYHDLDYTKYVVQDPNLIRPNELPFLLGSAQKIKSKLGWEPTKSFEELMYDLSEYWLAQLKNKPNLVV